MNVREYAEATKETFLEKKGVCPPTGRKNNRVKKKRKKKIEKAVINFVCVISI